MLSEEKRKQLLKEAEEQFERMEVELQKILDRYSTVELVTTMTRLAVIKTNGLDIVSFKHIVAKEMLKRLKEGKP